MPYYKNLQDYLAYLDKENKLIHITRPINKDTELHPLVRLQFRGLQEKDRKAFIFENIIDSRERKYEIPVAICCMAGSREIYAMGMQCKPEEIAEKWEAAQLNPIPPIIVEEGPCQEVILLGRDLEGEGNGLDRFPIPISTPGFDSSPYTTASHWVTKDPETGNYNVGNYRGQIKASNRIGCFPASLHQHIGVQWRKYKEMGKDLEAAIVIGVPPNISYVSVAKVPYGIDEYSVAGGLAQEPVPLVKCKTVDLAVPAEAQIVIEGIIPTTELEPEGPFGEFAGYMGIRELTMFMNVTCITHRRNPIYQAFLSQFPPSESSKIRQISWENIIRKNLKIDCEMENVLDVALHESTGSWGMAVIQIKDPKPGDFETVVHALSEGKTRVGKMIVLVDEDINIRDADSVNWAISYRMQPHRDVRIAKVSEMGLDCSTVQTNNDSTRNPTNKDEKRASILFVDATRKWAYPPVSLPSKEVMEKAIEIWKEIGLPQIEIRNPLYGYELGFWTEEYRKGAELALEGKYFETGVELAKGRQKI